MKIEELLEGTTERALKRAKMTRSELVKDDRTRYLNMKALTSLKRRPPQKPAKVKSVEVSRPTKRKEKKISNLISGVKTKRPLSGEG